MKKESLTYRVTLTLDSGKERYFSKFKAGSEIKLPPFKMWQVSINEGTAPETLKTIVDDVNVRGLPYVKFVFCSVSAPTDTFLYGAEGVRNLRELTVVGDVTDCGMKSIGKCVDLEKLAIGVMPDKITDAGLKYLSKLKHLRFLEIYLWGENATDHGCKCIAKLRSLNVLELRGQAPNITNQGFLLFKNLTNLKQLKISHDGLSQEAVEELADALPDCEIDCNHKLSPEREKAQTRKKENSGDKSADLTQLAPAVLKQLKRLGATLRKSPLEFEPAKDWPAPIRQLICGVEWPAGVSFVEVRDATGIEYSDIGFCVPGCDFELHLLTRPFIPVGTATEGAVFLITPLDCDNPSDPPIYIVDHESVADDDLMLACPLSIFLAALDRSRSKSTTTRRRAR